MILWKKETNLSITPRILYNSFDVSAINVIQVKDNIIMFVRPFLPLGTPVNQAKSCFSLSFSELQMVT